MVALSAPYDGNMSSDGIAFASVEEEFGNNIECEKKNVPLSHKKKRCTCPLKSHIF